MQHPVLHRPLHQNWCYTTCIKEGHKGTLMQQTVFQSFLVDPPEVSSSLPPLRELGLSSCLQSLLIQPRSISSSSSGSTDMCFTVMTTCLNPCQIFFLNFFWLALCLNYLMLCFGTQVKRNSLAFCLCRLSCYSLTQTAASVQVPYTRLL